MYKLIIHISLHLTPIAKYIDFAYYYVRRTYKSTYKRTYVRLLASGCNILFIFIIRWELKFFSFQEFK